MLLQNAVVMGDSHGEHVRAAQILDGVLEREGATASATDLVEALAYRAELALRSEDTRTAAEVVERARAVRLSEAERDAIADSLAALDDITAALTLDTAHARRATPR
jgi:hypothetical protein